MFHITQPLDSIRYMVYNGYYKVMSNIPKMGHLPTPDIPNKSWVWVKSGLLGTEFPGFFQLFCVLNHDLGNQFFFGYIPYMAMENPPAENYLHLQITLTL